jgi:hypothetical protein
VVVKKVRTEVDLMTDAVVETEGTTDAAAVVEIEEVVVTRVAAIAEAVVSREEEDKKLANVKMA